MPREQLQILQRPTEPWRSILLISMAFLGFQTSAFAQSSSNHLSRHIQVQLKEFSIHLNTATIPAGPITFEAENRGTQVHELVVLRTNHNPETLPRIRKPGATTDMEGGMIVDEQDPTIEPIDEIEEFPAGTKAVKQIDLAPGRYVLFCNIPGHYTKGMFASLYVTAK